MDHKTTIPKTKISGLGDLIKWIASHLSFTTCAACERRRVWLNRLLPFRRRTPQEKVSRALKSLHGKSIDDLASATLHLKYKEDILQFRKAFGQQFEDLAKNEGKRFHILLFDEEVLHCALIPTPHTKVRIKREDRKQIEKEIKQKTRWKRVKWYA